jgi:hypothetical protein
MHYGMHGATCTGLSIQHCLRAKQAWCSRMRIVVRAALLALVPIVAICRVAMLVVD